MSALRRLVRHAWPLPWTTVVLALDHDTLAALRAHERIHVQQYERWGPLFVPAYLGSSLLQWLRGQDPYLSNWFEREAFGDA